MCNFFFSLFFLFFFLSPFFGQVFGVALSLGSAFVLDEFLVVPGSLAGVPSGVLPGRWEPCAAIYDVAKYASSFQTVSS